MDPISMLPPPGPPSLPQDDGIRELTLDEIASVEHIFKAAGHDLPDPAVSSFVGAVENGKVIGFIVLQAKLHAEPMWIEPGRSDLFQPIVDEAEKVVLARCGPVWAYLFAPAGRVTRLAQTQGFQLEPFVILSKLIAPEIPAKPSMGDLSVPRLSVDNHSQGAVTDSEDSGPLLVGLKNPHIQ